MNQLSENKSKRRYGPQDAHALIVILFIAAVIIGMAVKITFF